MCIARDAKMIQCHLNLCGAYNDKTCILPQPLTGLVHITSSPGAFIFFPDLRLGGITLEYKSKSK